MPNTTPKTLLAPRFTHIDATRNNAGQHRTTKTSPITAWRENYIGGTLVNAVKSQTYLAPSVFHHPMWHKENCQAAA